MASADLELYADDQQQLLTETPQPRKSHGRFAVLAAASGAALIGFAACSGSRASPVVDPVAARTIRLNQIYAKVRELAAKGKGKEEDEKTVVCDLELLDIDLCGDDKASPDVMCETNCLTGYEKVVAACPTDRAKQSADRLKVCEKHGKKAEETPKDIKDELSEDEKAMEACMPALEAMASACGMDADPEPDLLCSAGCQDSIEKLKNDAKCSKGGMDELDDLVKACTGCAGSITKNFAIGAKAEKVLKDCGVNMEEGESPETPFKSKNFKACNKECKAAVCDLKKECPKDKDTDVPGLGAKEVNEMLTDIDKSMAAGKCKC